MVVGFHGILDYEYVLKMPSETGVMDSVSKEEEDTETSNEQSVALMTLNSAFQESDASAKHIDTHLMNANSNKVSMSDVTTKFLVEDVVSTTSDSSIMTNDLFETENLCSQDKTTGNVSILFVNTFNCFNLIIFH